MRRRVAVLAGLLCLASAPLAHPTQVASSPAPAAPITAQPAPSSYAGGFVHAMGIRW